MKTSPVYLFAEKRWQSGIRAALGEKRCQELIEQIRKEVNK